jgi:hypothetical protein
VAAEGGDQFGQRLGLQQRRVAGQHHHRARGVGRHRVERNPNRVAGAVLLLLHDGLGVRRDVSQMRGDLVAGVPDDDDRAGGVERGGRGQDVADP